MPSQIAQQKKKAGVYLLRYLIERVLQQITRAVNFVIVIVIMIVVVLFLWVIFACLILRASAAGTNEMVSIRGVVSGPHFFEMGSDPFFPK